MNFENERERNKWKAQPKQWDLLLKAVDQQCCGHIWKFRLMKIRKKSQMESRNIPKIITISSYFSAVLMLYPHNTDAIPHMYWCYPSTILNSLHSTDIIPHSTEQPPQYRCYPSTVLMLSLHMYLCYPPQYCSYPSTVLNSLRSTDSIPPQYWCYPLSTDAFPHSTEQPLQYWWYPLHVLMLSPTALNSLRSTGPTLYGVVMTF